MSKFFVLLAMVGSCAVTVFILIQLWSHIALIAALVVAAVITMIGFETWEEGHPRLE